jgi:hypothetical protein
MGNARWAGVRLKDVLDRAGVKPGAVQARFHRSLLIRVPLSTSTLEKHG